MDMNVWKYNKYDNNIEISSKRQMQTNVSLVNLKLVDHGE